MKKRNKKNNQRERQNKIALAMTKGYGLAKVRGNGCEVVNLQSYRRIPNVYRSLANMLTEVPHRWVVALIIDCTEKNGKNKFIIDEIHFKDRKSQHELAEYLTEQYSELIDDCASKMTVNYSGWIACTNRDIEFCEDGTRRLMLELLNK